MKFRMMLCINKYSFAILGKTFLATACPWASYTGGKDILMRKLSITFANGQTLAVGDTFYFVDPELHDGTIKFFTVDSFWPADPYYGEKIRCTSKERSEWLFVHKEYFERTHPTCFLNYSDAKEQANSQLHYSR